ncbi:glutamate 5-kinase [Plantactinospora sp. KLBMP9567]|uniref:glutamate 5-kinase n=1 Tax=Plantactinospora sp. KLBMP9567 TaxID=3085900 RepID=UPI0029810B5D|nr:glutamate 5-kinase [Plantactinospora sp. KLBMP9567]MDW5324698.1 glutamate 5-kinase [Plantactinospora sp. KLBMP9567]
MREAVTTARRIVVKVGSSSLTTAAGGLDAARIDALADVLAGWLADGPAGAPVPESGTRPAGPGRKRVGPADRRELVLVSSGAIAAGLAPLGLAARPRDLATQQAAASVGQGLLIGRYSAGFARHARTVGQVLLTVDDVTRRAHYRNAYRTLRKLLDLGAVPIVNENDTVATDEIRFGDNDRLAALVAALVHADLLVLLSDVDALYTGDPARPGTVRIEEVRDEQDLADVAIGRAGRAGVGTGGMVTKVEAARIATGFGIPVVLTSAPLAPAALAGEPVGTFFHRVRQRPAARLFWLAHATSPRGRLHLDPGAVQAVVARRKSLLPAGITAVDGTFTAGDPVDLVDDAGSAVARGLVNYDAVELPGLLGRSTSELAAALGPGYEREVVHRDDLVLLV